jgi:hypothetical protein
LALLPGPWSPRTAEAIVRLGTMVPFEQVPEQLAFFTGVAVSRATARRLTETAGAQLEAVEAAELATLEAQLPPPPPGPAVQQVSADGALVPLVGGQWSEVKLLTIGTVSGRPAADGTLEPHTHDLSYFARLTDAETFGRLATLETHQRGTVSAGTVAAVMDGAVWLQGLVDLQRPDAVRILDFPHAAQRLSAAAEAVWGPDSVRARCWAAHWRRTLRDGDLGDVLEAIATLPTATAADPAGAQQAVAETLGYLGARWAQAQYAAFRAQGFPIGSGCVESGHGVVMQARLKGRGMRWAPAHVNPLLALRCALVNGRWADRWTRLTAQWRRTLRQRRRPRRVQPPAAHGPAPTPPPPITASLPANDTAPATPPPVRPKTIVAGRPTTAHPWKRPLLAGGRAHNATRAIA